MISADTKSDFYGHLPVLKFSSFHKLLYYIRFTYTYIREILIKNNRMKQSFLRKVTGGVLLLLAGIDPSSHGTTKRKQIHLIITEDVDYADEVRVKRTNHQRRL